MRRRVLPSALVSAVALVGLVAQPGGAVNVLHAVVVSADPANWTPHVLDGKVDAIVVVGNKAAALDPTPARSAPTWPWRSAAHGPAP
jgi:hypothetical protein